MHDSLFAKFSTKLLHESGDVISQLISHKFSNKFNDNTESEYNVKSLHPL